MATNLFEWTRGLVHSCMVLGLCVSCADLAWAGDGDHRHSRQTCLIVDTDVATDDYRAFAVVFPNRDLRAVVVTEGISRAPNGSTAIALFLASGQSLAPVIPGLSAATPPVYDWLPGAREAAELMNHLLNASAPFAASSDQLKLSLLAAVRGCQRLDVLVLGPWSSFIEYAPMLRPITHRVVASGRPPNENNAANFNCVYDQTACDKAGELLRKFRHVAWVDLPLDQMTYPPTEQMVSQFAEAGMPGLLRALLNADKSQWLGSTRLWDDTAALYLLAPEHFKAVGSHFEPAIDEETLRSELVRAINATPDD